MYQSFQVTGVIKEILETRVFSEKFSERIVIVEYESSAEYKFDIALSFMNKRIGAIDAFKVGDRVTVNFNISSKLSKGNYYTKNQVWQINYALQ